MASYARSANRGGDEGCGGVASEFQNDDAAADDEAVTATIACFLLPYP